MGFDDSFLALVGSEGGLVDNPADPGGLTKYGISQRAYPGEDIRAMTIDRAKELYRRDYWGPAGCDAVPDAIKFDLFDSAVNQGVQTAIKTLQRMVHETPDGILGPLTLQAIQSMDPVRAALGFNAARLLAYTDDPHWSYFGRGWVARVAGNMQRA